MDDRDRRLRNLTYRAFVELGRAPRPREVAAEAGTTEEEVRAGWRRLHEGHALVLDRDTAELRMLNPFSALPTPCRVEAAGKRWYANCGWDAFGILAALRSDGRIDSACPDCREEMTIHVRDEIPVEKDAVFHCLVPAAGWWRDIVFT